MAPSITYNTPFIFDTHFWIFWTALFIAAAVSRMTRSLKSIEDPEQQDKARTRKWVMVCLWFSLALGMFLCALFIPGAEKILNIRLAYLGGAVFLLFFFMFRFKKALGLPLLLLIGISGLFLALFFQAITSFTGEEEIALLRVFSADGERMKLELERPGEEPELLDMEGTYLAPVVKVIIFEDFLVFLGAKTWYRFIGLTSMGIKAGEEIPEQLEKFHFDRPAGISEQLYDYYEKNEEKIPGVKSTQISMELKRLKSTTLYSVRLQNDGTIQIVVVE